MEKVEKLQVRKVCNQSADLASLYRAEIKSRRERFTRSSFAFECSSVSRCPKKIALYFWSNRQNEAFLRF